MRSIAASGCWFEGAGIVGLSGTLQVTAIETAYRILARRHDEGNGEYGIDHISWTPTSSGRISNLMQPERLASRLKQIVR